MNKKLLAVIIILIVILVGLLITSTLLFKEKPKDLEEIVDTEGNIIDTSSGQFATVKEAVQYLKIPYIKMVESQKQGFTIDLYLEFTKELTLKNESYFDLCIRTVASEIKYNSFRIIDEKNNIEIEVQCDSKKGSISKILINQDDNYFNRLKITKQVEEYRETPITNVKLDSTVLKNIIDNNWDMEAAGYTGIGKDYVQILTNVYAKVIDGKFYEIYFGKKYKAPIISNLIVGDSFEKIEQVLGESLIECNKFSYPIGYKTKDFYIFFSELGIWVQRRESKVDNTLQEAIEIIEKENNVEKAVNLITTKWNDYDEYEKTDKGITVKYTLKGIEIQTVNTSKPQIIIYSNYEGKVKGNKTIRELSNVSLPPQITLNLDENLIYENICKEYESYTAS